MQARNQFALCCLAIGLTTAQVTTGEQSSEAAAVLDRYVAVTGGAAAYRKVGAQVLEITMTPSNGPAMDVTIFQARDGRQQIELQKDKVVHQQGVLNGTAWEYTEAEGPRILSGKEAEHRIAAAQVFLEDDWRKQYPGAVLLGEEKVNGTSCAHVRLTRKDGAIRDVFYDKTTGLLVRELAKDDPQEKSPRITTVTGYASSQGLKYVSSAHIEQGGRAFDMKVDNASFSAAPPRDAFVLPDRVLRAMSETQTKPGVPRPADLLDRYISVTGGKAAYAAVKTEKITADLTFAAVGLKGKLVMYEAVGGKMYTTFDLPGAGKFESGSDGTTAWERSVILGPRLVPKSEGGRGMLGPAPDQVMDWSRAYQSIETVGKEEANGAPCWSVRITPRGGQAASTMCFDVETGYLSRLTGTAQTQMGNMPLDLTFSNYQSDGPMKNPHHLETHVSGQALNIDLTEVLINGPIPDDTFDLPAEIKALKDKKATTIDNSKGPDPERPTLRRAR